METYLPVSALVVPVIFWLWRYFGFVSAIGVGVFIFGTLLFLILLDLYPPHIQDDPLVWQIPLFSYGFGLFVMAVFGKKFLNYCANLPMPKKGREVSRRYSFPPFLYYVILPVYFVPLGFDAFLFGNAYFDMTLPQPVHYSVIQKRIVERKFQLDVRLREDPDFTNAVNVDRETYNLSREGSKIEVMVKGGYFHMPWVVDYKLQD